MSRERRPCWATVNAEVLADEARLARVLADMGFSMHLSVVARGEFRWWQPDYRAVSGRWAPSHREMVAANNRTRRDAPVHVLIDAGRGGFVLDAHTGEWRDNSGALRGDDLLSLGALRWSIRYGQAGARIARVAGFRIPFIPVSEVRHAA